MPDPKLELFNGAGTKVDENDTWAANTLATQNSVGAFAFPANSKDAVLVVTLAPGGYTAQGHRRRRRHRRRPRRDLRTALKRGDPFSGLLATCGPQRPQVFCAQVGPICRRSSRAALPRPPP